MNLETYHKFEDKLYLSEKNRLIKLGYTEEDAVELANTGINTKVTNLLLLELFLMEQKKNGR